MSKITRRSNRGKTAKIAIRPSAGFVGPMSLHQSNTDRPRVPTRREAAVFRFKTLLLQTKRLIGGLFDRKIKRFQKSDRYSNLPVIADSYSRLWSEASD